MRQRRRGGRLRIGYLAIEVIGEDGGCFSDVPVAVARRECKRRGAIAGRIADFEYASETNGARPLASTVSLLILARLVAHQAGNRIVARLGIFWDIEPQLPGNGRIIILKGTEVRRVFCLRWRVGLRPL